MADQELTSEQRGITEEMGASADQPGTPIDVDTKALLAAFERLMGPLTPDEALRVRLDEAKLRAETGSARCADRMLLLENLSPEELAEIPSPQSFPRNVRIR